MLFEKRKFIATGSSAVRFVAMKGYSGRVRYDTFVAPLGSQTTHRVTANNAEASKSS